jgi:adenylate kinase family enzyme
MRSPDGADVVVAARALMCPDPSTLVWRDQHAAKPGVAVGAGLGEPAGDGGRLIAVVGPPAVGKTTATALTAAALGAKVVRLREFAERYRTNHPELGHLFATVDPLGWLDDDTVKILLDMAIGDPGRTGTLLLENLPGNAVQLRHLVELAAANNLGCQVVELVTADSLLAVRARTRRVCPCCEPDPRGDPHRPARGLVDLPDRCARCGGRLVPRRSDEPGLFQERLRRFRDNHPHIRATMLALRVPHGLVDATGDPASVAGAFLAACQPAAATILQGAST